MTPSPLPSICAGALLIVHCTQRRRAVQVSRQAFAAILNERNIGTEVLTPTVNNELKHDCEKHVSALPIA